LRYPYTVSATAWPALEGASGIAGPKYLHVSGFSRRSSDQRHLHWGEAAHTINPGDVVTIRVLESTNPDLGAPSHPAVTT
jgi:hypothetical protein